MNHIIELMIPGLVAVAGNILVYIIVKKRIDNSIEKHKISYAGVFKEKIVIHKELLGQLFQLKLKIQQYQVIGDKKTGNELFFDINKFINYYTVNQPFLRQELLICLKEISNELQSCFENFYKYYFLEAEEIDPIIKTETLKKFYESENKFKENEPFRKIERLIISEMKKDLRIEE